MSCYVHALMSDSSSMFVAGSGARRKCMVRLLAAVLVVVMAAGPVGASTTASQAGVPSAPTGLSGTVSWDRAELSWDDPGDAAVVGYQVLRRDKDLQGVGVFSVLVEDTGSADTGFVDDSVEPERRYVYRVKARSVAGLSQWSHWLKANTPAAPAPPAPPTGLVGSVGDDSVVLSWDDPGDAAVVGYQVLRRDKDLQGVGVFSVLVDDTGSADTGFVDDSVEPERRYVYRVKARSVAGLSRWSHWFKANTPAAPAPPVSGPTRGLSGSDGPEFEAVWSSVLSVGVLAGGVPGFQNYQGPSFAQGSLSQDEFTVDGEPVWVTAVFNHAGLVLGLSDELPRDFVLRAGSREFVASDSLVQSMGIAQGRYWWPTAPMGWSVGDEVELSIAISDSGSMPPRPPAPPSAYFENVPVDHDGVSQFEMRLIFDHANMAIDAAMLKDHALAVTGADIADVRRYSPGSKQSWVVTLQPTGPGAVTLALPAATDCALLDAVCTDDARGLRAEVRAEIAGSGAADGSPPEGDYAADTSTTGRIAVGSWIMTEAHTGTDRDWFAVEFEAGQMYQIEVTGSEWGTGTLRIPRIFSIRDSSGERIRGALSLYQTWWIGKEQAFFVPTENGTHYVDTGSFVVTASESGTYRVSVSEVLDDFAATTETAGAVEVGGSTTGELSYYFDRDWFSVDFEAGKSYELGLSGDGPGTNRPIVYGIYDSTGSIVSDRNDNLQKLSYFEPKTDGTYYLGVRERYGLSTGYNLSVAEVEDDFAAAIITNGMLEVGGPAAEGVIDFETDRDWFAVELEADKMYRSEVRSRYGGGSSPLNAPNLDAVHDPDGQRISNSGGYDGGHAIGFFVPSQHGTYYFSVNDFYDNVGGYSVAVSEVTDDFSADVDTAGTVRVGGSVSGEIQFDGVNDGRPDDEDWFAVNLEAGTTYQIDLNGVSSGAGSLPSPRLLGIRDSSGVRLGGTANNNGGQGNDSRKRFTPDQDGTYYIEVSSERVSYAGTKLGTYKVRVRVLVDGEVV